MPGADAATDGIVIDQKYFQRADGSVPQDAGGKDFALGRTLVHLMGSYLNLYELWNDEVPCADDFVDDTPIHNAPNYGKSDYKHVTTCDGHAVEMTMNLMDSGCDTTMYMFTWGQVARMQATLSAEGPRARLTKSTTRCNKDDKKRLAERSENNLVSSGTIQVRTVPNPNSGDFTIEIQTNELSSGAALIQVLNSSGELMLERENLLLPASVSSIPILGYKWPDGVYFVRVTTANDIQVKKIIINH